MQKSLLLAASSLGLASMACSVASAQASATANFGSFYGAAGGVSRTILVGTAGAYTITSGQNCNTPEGFVSMPTSWSNIAGRATNQLTVGFGPKLVNGSFSGTCTATYNNSSSNGPSTLTLSVSYTGNNMVPTATAGLKYEVLSIVQPAG